MSDWVGIIFKHWYSNKTEQLVRRTINSILFPRAIVAYQIYLESPQKWIIKQCRAAAGFAQI